MAGIGIALSRNRNIRQGGQAVAITRVNRVPRFIGSCVLFAVLAVPSIASAQRVEQRGDYDYKEESKRREFSSSVRLQLQPNDGEVYIDGRYAGRVDDFDGIFQKMRVTPGHHQIAIWREGYRTEFHNLYFTDGRTEYLRGNMERLRPGMASGPRPGRGRGYAWGQPPWAQGQGPGQYPDRVRFGTVTLAIPVSGAEIYVDGSRRNWQRRAGNQFELDLAPGRHRIEVRRAGYQTFAREVVVRPGADINVNVSMRRGNPR